MKLSISEVTKSFGAMTALDSVSLTVEDGEFVTILGPSGSGKTTLLKSIAGFEPADSGDIRLNDESITGRPARHRNIGMVFQNYALFPHLTVAQNVAFPLQMRHVTREEIDRQVQEYLTLVELQHLGHRFPKQLSGGQQQRVALARALVFQPRILLLDEPFGALDRKLRESLQVEIRRLQKKLRLTTVFITHDQEEALLMSDRIAVMNAGRIEQVDVPSEVYFRPATRFVAEFVGESNIMQCSQSGPSLDLAGFNSAIMNDRPSDKAGYALVRPESVRLGKAAMALPFKATGKIDEILSLGGAVKVRLITEGGGEFLARVPLSKSEHLEFGEGDTVPLGFALGDVHLLAGTRHA